MPISEAHNIDNMAFMATLPDGFFDLAIVDPPYGIGADNGTGKYGRFGNHSRGKNKKEWDKQTPDDEYFMELFRVSQNQIVWGANNFPFVWRSPCTAFIFWDKGVEIKGRDFSDGELAWTSFSGRAREVELDPKDKDRIHPTQKPVALYKWLLTNYAKPGDKIFDSHMGSQSSRIAAYDKGFDYWGCELDKEYYDEGCKRFEVFKSQLKLFT